MNTGQQGWGKAKVSPDEILQVAKTMAAVAHSWGIDPNDAESDVAYYLLLAAQKYGPGDYARVMMRVARNAVISLGRRCWTRREVGLEEVDNAGKYE